MTLITVIKIGRALLGVTAIRPVLDKIPKPLKRAARILGWVAVTILAMQTIPFIVMDIQAATGKANPAGIAWFWNAWFTAWLLTFLPAKWLSETKHTPKKTPE